MTYPDGMQVNYSRDAAGRIIAVIESKNGVTQAVVTNITYEPFGPMTGLTYGNGLAETRSYDEDYRVTAITIPAVESWSFAHNADNDVIGVSPGRRR